MAEPYSSPQAQIFGDDAASYDRFRPAYPRELIEQVVAGSSPDLPVLEVGAGTGKATRALIALDRSVFALEPDTRMAAVLALNCPEGKLELSHATLESALLPAHGFGLVVAAQSWHWVDPTIGYDIAADALTEGGALALLWHHPRAEQGMFGVALKQLYAQVAPSIGAVLPGNKAIDFDPRLEPLAATSRFGQWVRLEHRWRRQLDAPNLIGWLCSSSDHRMLSVEKRAELMSGVAALVVEFGGQVHIAMSTIAHVGRRL